MSLRARANLHIERDDWSEEALRVYSELCTLHPSVARWGNLRAKCLERLGRYDECEAACQQVLERDPTNRIALSRLGRVRAELEPRREVERLLEQDPETLIARLAAARASDRDLRFVHHAAYRLAVTRDTPEALTRYAAVLRAQGRLADAERVYLRALAKEPENRAAENGLCAVLRDAGRIDEARQRLERLRRRHPDDQFILMTLGAVHLDFAAVSGDLASLERGEQCLRAAWRLGARGGLTSAAFERARAVRDRLS